MDDIPLPPPNPDPMPAKVAPKGQKHMGPDHPRIRFLAFALIVILSTGTGYLGGWLSSKQNGADAITTQKDKVILETQGDLISEIANKVGESVVSITVQSHVDSIFFGGGSSVLEGAGTGIILTEDGLIVTNRHVVPEGTTEISVTLSDGTEFEGVEIVGRTGSNDSLDVAFLKIPDTKGKKLKPATIGDSAKMQVGDPVIAIGNALGQFQNTVTSGIISGYGRSIEAANGDGTDIDSLENLFQTDAAINAGNSGGPLVNLNGEVIGINTAVASGDAQNIGFSIPINDVAGLIKSVKEKGVLERPFIGIMYIPLTNDAAEAYGLSVNRGAYVPPNNVIGGDSVINGGPADKAGIREGDIITKIDGTAINHQNSLSALINKYAVGDTVKLTVIRDGKEQTIEVTLGAAPTD